jgi:signal transduction histidine kinase
MRTLRYEPRGELTGEWDAARLRQVVSNLLGNALQHGAGTGPVELSVSAEERNGASGADGAEGGERAGIRLVVRNDGPPIPRDALPTIFDPLVRGPSPASAELQKQRRPGSIGLGLYIAREVAAAHGGTIEVASSAESGTAFTVRLPRRRPNTF